MLQAYRSTPHPARNLASYQLLKNRDVRTKLDHFPTETQEKYTKIDSESIHSKETNGIEHYIICLLLHSTKTLQLIAGQSPVN